MNFNACGHHMKPSYTSEAPRMRPVKSTIRAAAPAGFAALTVSVVVAFAAASGAGCVSKARTPGGTPSGEAGSLGSAGSPAGAGAGAAGAGAAGAGAGVDLTGAAGMAPAMGTVHSGAGGTVDQGRLFTDAAAITTSSADAGGPSTLDAPADAGGNTIPGDGNTSTCHVGGMSYVLVFSQRGADVTMVVTANNCAAGSHAIQIRGGFSCDNAGTEGGVWDGQRGAGIPSLSCSNNKGTLTYTRSGADPATRWTVGDHDTKTDVTLHPMSVDSSCGTFF
jgi:hypothetical protein